MRLDSRNGCLVQSQSTHKMELQVDVWLRGTDFAKTQIISGIGVDPAAWTDNDVSKLLKAMLLSIHRAKNPSCSSASTER